MKIRSVSYRGMVQLAPFCMAHIEASGEVDEGEDPSAALLSVRDFVDSELERMRGAFHNGSLEYGDARRTVTTRLPTTFQVD